jgi:hypothetical protein
MDCNPLADHVYLCMSLCLKNVFITLTLLKVQKLLFIVASPFVPTVFDILLLPTRAFKSPNIHSKVEALKTELMPVLHKNCSSYGFKDRWECSVHAAFWLEKLCCRTAYIFR